MSTTLPAAWSGLVDDAAIFPPGDVPLPDAVDSFVTRRDEWYADLVGSFVHPNELRKPIHQLTPRQREVLQLLAEGRSMKEAAAILNISPRTIAFHKYRMMEQLRVQSTAALIQFAMREGLI